VPNIWGFSVWYFLYVDIPIPRIVSWLVGIWKNLHHWVME